MIDFARLRRPALALGRWLLPSACPVCGEPSEGDHGLCRDCLRQLPWNRSRCARCALPLPRPEPACGRCLRRPPPYDAALAPLLYGFPVDRLLPRFKFHGDLAAGRILVEALLAEAADRERPEALIPVPLHPGRLRRRGYNQALELARPLARALALPLRIDGLVRVRDTAAQSELKATARRRNVRGAFVVGADLPERVAVIDDTMTTGATLAECARALKHAGVPWVEVWAAARAPSPGS